jgi:hypothetical protein
MVIEGTTETRSPYDIPYKLEYEKKISCLEESVIKVTRLSEILKIPIEQRK